MKLFDIISIRFSRFIKLRIKFLLSALKFIAVSFLYKNKKLKSIISIFTLITTLPKIFLIKIQQIKVTTWEIEWNIDTVFLILLYDFDLKYYYVFSSLL